MAKDPHEILEYLESVRAETLQRLNTLNQEQLDWRPPLNGEGKQEWSLGEIFMHIAIDEHYLRENIARPLLEGVKPPDDVAFLPPPPSYATTKEVILFWFARAREITRRLFENWPQDANVELTHVGGLRAMNGAEWLEGYGGHEAFHHKQLDALLTQVNGALK